MYKLFKAMHTDIKKLCNENYELNKEIHELKSIVTNSNNSGGGKKKQNVLDYDSSWFTVCILFLNIFHWF